MIAVTGARAAGAVDADKVSGGEPAVRALDRVGSGFPTGRSTVVSDTSASGESTLWHCSGAARLDGMRAIPLE
ncbi:hypothetical protein ACFYZE_09215 [Streptomyces sp. NPDC001796]|uniref:hypothetical protein n=1 Tax=Streptomyces sp. NPDC001796 TaxID=3364609 RepID=UPI0036AB27EE